MKTAQRLLRKVFSVSTKWSAGFYRHFEPRCWLLTNHNASIAPREPHTATVSHFLLRNEHRDEPDRRSEPSCSMPTRPSHFLS